MSNGRPAIGGFFPLHLSLTSTRYSILACWNVTSANSVFFHNARSALHHLCTVRNFSKIWLPAYCCLALAEGVGTYQVGFYPLTESLSPNVNFLATHVRAEEAVVVIDYFGRLPEQSFLDFAKERSDITWIEDWAQALLPGGEPFGDYLLYSPRKIVGVPDGGILQWRKEGLPAPVHSPLRDAAFITASLLRYEDKEEQHNAEWYGHYVQYEHQMRVGEWPMSRFSRQLLSLIDLPLLGEQRKKNYAYLAQHLSDIAFYRTPSEAVPFGFPIRVKDAAAFSKQLHARRIFAARHWAELPVTEPAFALEKTLSETLLTLPCDHRYDESAMRDMVSIVREILS